MWGERRVAGIPSPSGSHFWMQPPDIHGSAMPQSLPRRRKSPLIWPTLLFFQLITCHLCYHVSSYCRLLNRKYPCKPPIFALIFLGSTFVFFIFKSRMRLWILHSSRSSWVTTRTGWLEQGFPKSQSTRVRGMLRDRATKNAIRRSLHSVSNPLHGL